MKKLPRTLNKAWNQLDQRVKDMILAKARLANTSDEAWADALTSMKKTSLNDLPLTMRSELLNLLIG